MSKPAMRADEVLLAVSKRHREDVWLTEVKTGPTWSAPKGQMHRIDGLAIKKSWSAPQITGYEVKVDRQDWVRDDKWHAALSDCHAFNIACPPELIAPEEVPAEVGLVWVSAGGRLSVRRKAVRRDVGLPAPLLYYIAISRTDSDRHPFFTDARADLEAWVADKSGRATLGYAVGERLRTRVNEAVVAAQMVEAGASEAREKAERWKRAVAIMGEFGIHVSPWDERWEQQLRAALSGGGGVRVRRAVADLARRAAELQRMLDDAAPKPQGLDLRAVGGEGE